eukprot:8098465-Pyramimonas_sp.AAC.1
MLDAPLLTSRTLAAVTTRGTFRTSRVATHAAWSTISRALWRHPTPKHSGSANSFARSRRLVPRAGVYSILCHAPDTVFYWQTGIPL